MSPARRVKQAEDAARKLASLLSIPATAQVLQHVLPSSINTQQREHLIHAIHALKKLTAALQEACTADTVQVLNAVLRQHVARSIGLLVAWAQQQPEQLIAMTASGVMPQDHSLATWVCVAGHVWELGWVALDSMFSMSFTMDKNSASHHRIATNITEQLESSGRAP
jgi:hypothetical protein